MRLGTFVCLAMRLGTHAAEIAFTTKIAYGVSGFMEVSSKQTTSYKVG